MSLSANLSCLKHLKAHYKNTNLYVVNEIEIVWFRQVIANICVSWLMKKQKPYIYMTRFFGDDKEMIDTSFNIDVEYIESTNKVMKCYLYAREWLVDNALLRVML